MLKTVLARRAVHKRFPDWEQLLGGGWRKLSQRHHGGAKKVLIATSIGGDAPSSTIESLLAVALTLRGVQAEVLLCDTLLPACMRGNINNYDSLDDFLQHGPRKKHCVGCFDNSEACFSSAGITVRRYSEYVTDEQKTQAARLATTIAYDDIHGFVHDQVAVGEHAVAGALRFFARGTLAHTPEVEVVVRRYFEAALLTCYALDALIDKEGYDVVVSSHGIYVPLGIIGEVARRKNTRVVNWVIAYRKQRFIFSHGDTYHHTMIEEPIDAWGSVQWNDVLEKRTVDYLESRMSGSKDWIWFHEKPEEEISKIAREVGIDLNKPTIGLLTNVIWDAQLHFKTNAFKNMVDWVEQTIQYFAKRPELQLLIRVHPAEIRGTVKSRQLVGEEIKARFPQLPSNVFVVDAASPVSTYVAMEACDSAIIYGTKTGIELISRGIPVIVAGEAWVRGKGLTLDAESPDGYFKLLDQLPFGKRLSAEQTSRARQYAHHFFFRRMIPLSMVVPDDVLPPFKISVPEGAKNLLPGGSEGLDVICDGIIHGSPFIYKDEEAREPQFD